jgi:hypothetical protein
MSGRLVILPHKRWNVWNADNVEKVLKDERVEREQQEAERSRGRRTEQEASYEKLIGSKAITTGHINLVSAETISGSRNEDFEREKREKEERRLRKEGVAPWALGDGVS